MGCCSFVTDPINSLIDGASDFLSSVYDEFEGIAKNVLEEAFRVLGITDETIYAVSVSTKRLIPDPQDGSVKNIILNHALINTSIAAGLQQANLTGVKANILKYLRYGQDQYINDIPTGGLWYHNINKAAVDVVLDSIEGVGTTIDTLKIQQCDINEYIQFRLQETTVYNYQLNRISSGGLYYYYTGYTLDGVTGDYQPLLIAEEDRKRVVYQETTIATVGTTETTTRREHTKITKVIGGATVSDIYAPGSEVTVREVTTDINSVTNIELSEELFTELFTWVIADIPDINLLKAYIIAEYYLDSAPTINKLWVYDKSSGVYPALDDLVGGGLDTTLMLPIIPIREDFISLNDSAVPNALDSSRGLLQTIGLEIDSYIDAVNSNADLEFIEDAAILFAINVYTQSQSGIKALYNLFAAIEEFQDIDEFEYNDFPVGSNSPVNVYKIEELRINNVIQFNYITVATVNSVIGAVNSFTSVVTILPSTPVITPVDPEDFNPPPEPYGGENRSYITIKKQINATQHEVLEIHGLIMTTAIFTTVDEAKAVVMALEDDVEGNLRYNFSIPLSYAQMYDFTLFESEECVYEALSLTIYAKQTVYLDYYETAGFSKLLGIVILVVSVILFIVSLPAGGSAGQAFMLLGRQLLVQYALTMILSEILTHNLSDAEKAIVFAAYAYFSYQNMTSGLPGGTELSLADDIMFSINSVSDIAMIDQAIQLESLQSEIEEFSALAKSKSEQLEEAEAGLSIEGFRHDIVKTLVINTYEKPTNFYNRTIHTGNPGVIVLDQIESYHDQALKLPELN